MQMDFHITLYPFFTTKKIPNESTRSVRILLKCYSGGVVFVFAKCPAFCHPLQILLNWGILHYHYYCELQTIESELDLNCPQLRLRCSVAYAENFHEGVSFSGIPTFWRSFLKLYAYSSTRTVIISCVIALDISYQRSKLGCRRNIYSMLRHSSS